MPKKLTIWLVLLVIFWGPFQVIFTVHTMVTYGLQRYTSIFPNLQTAILLRHVFWAVSMLVWVHAALLLFRKQPGKLKQAQVSLLVGTALRLIGMFIVPIFGGLPKEMSGEMLQTNIANSIVGVLEVGVCYLYLIRSKRVQAIYAA